MKSTPPARRRLVTLMFCALGALAAGCGGGDGGSATALPAVPDTPYVPSPSSPDTPAIPDVPVNPDTPGVPDDPPVVDPVIETRMLSGAFEFGQTHIIGENDTRSAPDLVEGRGTLLQFTPVTAIPEDRNVFVEAMLNGVSLGRMYMAGPSSQPFFAEDRLSVTRLPSYNSKAWTVQMPAGWIRRGVALTVGYDEARESARQIDAWRATASLPALAPHLPFTFARLKVLLWGEDSHSLDTGPLPKRATDYYGVLPVGALRAVDYTEARWGYLVFAPADGAPIRATSQAAHASAGGGLLYSQALKQVAVLVNKANTGRGLRTSEYGDSSPYSFGSYVAQGQFLNSAGVYKDLNDYSAAGGWTGWSAIYWNTDCSYLFDHEVGHSLSLSHFFAGNAQSWVIADEYPKDAALLPTQPLPYDTVRGMYRTWYRVSKGFSYPASADSLVSRNDPMSYDNESNTPSCSSPYSGYHARKAQRWMRSTPTILEQDGVTGVYKWDDNARQYMPAAIPEADMQAPQRTNVPVATLMGTLAAATSPDARQIYPPIYAASGNTFVAPDPFKAGLPQKYNGAKYYLDVTYAGGRHEYALIQQAEITNPKALAQFSINVPLDERPVEMTLWEAAQPYPMITPTGNTALFTRAIDSGTALPEVVEVNPSTLLQHQQVTLSAICMSKSCGRQTVDVAWYPSDATSLHFVAQDATVGPTTAVGDANGQPMRLTVPMIGPDGMIHTVVVRAAKTVNAPNGILSMPANYRGVPPGKITSNLQRLVLWATAEDNAGLPSGSYATTEGVKLNVLRDNGELVDEVTVHASLQMPIFVTAGIDTPFYRPYNLPNSSIYFTTLDSRQGPTTGVWSYSSEPSMLHSRVQDAETGETVTATFRGYKRNCGAKGSRFTMNAGGYWTLTCEYGLELVFNPADNPGLASGHHYVTGAGDELMIDAHGWHIDKLLERVGIRWDFVMP